MFIGKASGLIFVCFRFRDNCSDRVHFGCHYHYWDHHNHFYDQHVLPPFVFDFTEISWRWFSIRSFGHVSFHNITQVLVPLCLVPSWTVSPRSFGFLTTRIAGLRENVTLFFFFEGSTKVSSSEDTKSIISLDSGTVIIKGGFKSSLVEKSFTSAWYWTWVRSSQPLLDWFECAKM